MILLVGPPGAGKSLQAKQLEQDCKVRWLSMGKLLRSDSNKELHEAMQRGDLVGDAAVQGVLVEAIESVDRSLTIILDGFPRIGSQADWFLDYLHESVRNIAAIVHIRISEEVSLERLAQRGRADDAEATVRHRYQQYLHDIIPMVEQLKADGYPYFEIDGDDTINNVHQKVVQALTGIIEPCSHA